MQHKKQATFLSSEDLSCMDESQCSISQRNSLLFHLDPNDKPTVSERNFVDDGVLPVNELHGSGRVRTRKRIYDAESGTYKPL